MENTEELIPKAQKGDRDALNSLLHKYSQFVKDIVRYYSMALSKEDREDLYIEGLIGLQRAVLGFKPEKGKRFEDFAYISVKNAIFDYLRKRKRAANVAVPSSYGGEDSLWEDLILFKEDIENFKETLTELEKKVLEQYLKGYKIGEIAKRLNIPYKSADNALQRIKKHLREYFSAE